MKSRKRVELKMWFWEHAIRQETISKIFKIPQSCISKFLNGQINSPTVRKALIELGIPQDIVEGK